MIREPLVARQMIANGIFSGPTCGICPGFAQGNLVMISNKYAKDFLQFANLNPKACPILYVSSLGERILKECAKGSDITNAIGAYNIFENGQLTSTQKEVGHLFQNDFVSFIIGCSFTFESELINEGIKLRHIILGKNVAMYDTNIPLVENGPFKGNMVVSMRPIKRQMLSKVIEISSQFPAVHGAPVHIGDPELIGIVNIEHPDYGYFVQIESDETPVFWACGVSPQNALKRANLPLAITHAPGHMLITDIPNSSLKVRD